MASLERHDDLSDAERAEMNAELRLLVVSMLEEWLAGRWPAAERVVLGAVSSLESCLPIESLADVRRVERVLHALSPPVWPS